MADNTELNAGSGGDTIATDDIGGIKHQRVKIQYGTDGSATDVSDSNPLPIDDAGGSITVDGTVTANAGTGPWPVTDNGGSLTVDNSDITTIAGAVSGSEMQVDVVAPLPAGTNAIGKLSANSGVDIGDVDVTSVTPGTAAANLGKAEDAAHTTGDVGVMALAVRKNADGPHSGADGDYEPLQTDANGFLKVNIKAGAGSGGTASTDDSAFTAGSGSGTPMMGFATSDTVDAGDVGVLAMDTNRNLKISIEADNAGIGGGTQYTEDAAAAANPVGNMNMAVRADSLSAVTSADGDNIALRATNNGELYVKHTDTIAVTQSGGWTVSTSGTTAVTQSGTWNLNDISGTISLPTGAATSANQSTQITALQLLDDVVSTDASASPTKGNMVCGHDGTNARRIAVDTAGQLQIDVVSSLPAGTNAIGKLSANSGVDIGDVDVTSISAGSNLIGDVGISGARTSGGTTLYKNIDVDETEDQVKGTAGQVYWIHAINLKATPLYLKFYNATAATVVVGTTTPALTFPVPSSGDTNGAGFTLAIPNGIEFSTAITIAATTGVADADTGAPGANELIVNLGYA